MKDRLRADEGFGIFVLLLKTELVESSWMIPRVRLFVRLYEQFEKNNCKYYPIYFWVIYTKKMNTTDENKGKSRKQIVFTLRVVRVLDKAAQKGYEVLLSEDILCNLLWGICFYRGVGLEDLQRSIPFQTVLFFVILWFCDSIKTILVKVNFQIIRCHRDERC